MEAPPIDGPVMREISIAASPDAVWTALTDPTELAAWFGAEADIDLRPGGAVRFRWTDGTERRGLVTEVDRPYRFAFRWREILATSSGWAVSDPTVVEFVLERREDGATRMRVTESPGIMTDRPLAMAEADR